MPQAHYTVGYHDVEQHHLEVCEYAENAYEAIEHSKEMYRIYTIILILLTIA